MIYTYSLSTTLEVFLCFIVCTSYINKKVKNNQTLMKKTSEESNKDGRRSGN